MLNVMMKYELLNENIAVQPADVGKKGSYGDCCHLTFNSSKVT